MKTKTQKILRTLIFLAAVLGLVACQGGEISISETNTPTPAATFTDVPPPPSSTPKPPTPVPTLDPSVVLVPRYILPGAPAVAIGILGTVCNYQTDSWGERTAYIAYDCPDLDVTWLSVRFTTLEEGENAQDLFGELPPEGHMAIASSDFLSHYDNLALSGRTENSEYAYFIVYETERYVISSEVFFPEDTSMSLEEFFLDNAEAVLHAVLEIMLEKVMSGGTPPEPTPMAVGQQELYEQIGHWLVTESEANEFYQGASDMWGDPFDGTWVSLGDDVDTQRGSVCREFEDRTNADAPLVGFFNCVYFVGPDYDLDKILENRPNAVVLESAFEYPDQSLIYGYDMGGHTSLNAFILQDEFLFYVFIESRTLGGQTPEGVFNEFNDGFINNVMMANLERYDPETADYFGAADNPYDEIEYDEPMVVDAGSCYYGGIIQKIESLDEFTVQFTMCKSAPAFLAKVAFTPFGIQPREYFDYTGGTGMLLEAPVGTGPYRVVEWARGESITYEAFEDYWGDAPFAQTVILRWNQKSSVRLLELQSGSVHMITAINPDDFATVDNDPALVRIPIPNPNILYIGFTNTLAPFDDNAVRQAVAMGIDRSRIVDNFYPPGSEVASHFTPCSIPNGCAGEEWYAFDIDAANAILDDAGFPRGDDGVRFSTAIYYRDIFRGYLPEPRAVAVELQTQLLDNLGIDAEVVVMESGEFIAASTGGQLDGIYLLGWGADYPHVTNFLDFHFNANNPQFGETFPAIYEALEAASQIADPADAEALYADANNAIKEFVPMIPVVHSSTADAALASLAGAYTPPFGATQFQYLDPGSDTLVYMQSAEPNSIYCADETNGESLRPCQQVVETLLEYGQATGETHGELATSCTGNADSTVWTCILREGVKFHDGSAFDANDVVASWAAGIDASNPNHVGNTGGFDYIDFLWDGLMNAGE